MSEKNIDSSRYDETIDERKRREEGAFYTKKKWVDHAHKFIDNALGDDWREKYVVVDPAAGTQNLTKEYDFHELYSMTLNQEDINVATADKYGDAINRVIELYRDGDSLIDGVDVDDIPLRRSVEDILKERVTHYDSDDLLIVDINSALEGSGDSLFLSVPFDGKRIVSLYLNEDDYGATADVYDSRYQYNILMEDFHEVRHNGWSSKKLGIPAELLEHLESRKPVVFVINPDVIDDEEPLPLIAQSVYRYGLSDMSFFREDISRVAPHILYRVIVSNIGKHFNYGFDDFDIVMVTKKPYSLYESFSDTESRLAMLIGFSCCNCFSATVDDDGVMNSEELFVSLHKKLSVENAINMALNSN